MALKWALVDLIKVIDAAHEGRLHDDLARIARTLGVELTQPVVEVSQVDWAKARLAEIHDAKAKKAAKGVT